MLGAVLLVLVIGALLAAIFGRSVAQRFVMGTATLVSVCIAAVGIIVLVIVVIGAVQMQAVPQPASVISSPSAPSSPSVSTYSPPEVSTSQAPPAPVYQAQAAPVAPPPPAPAAPRQWDNVYNPMTGRTVGAGPTIGIGQQSIAPEDETRLGLAQGYGVLVSSVRSGGPADVAGIKTGDVLTSMDGLAISTWNQLTDYEAKRGAGQPISLFVYRVADGRILKGPILVTPR